MDLLRARKAAVWRHHDHPCQFHGALETQVPANLHGRDPLAALMVPMIEMRNLASEDLLCFLSASLIRGTSGQDAVLVHRMSSRAQWIDSKSNPADGLSRDRLADAWTMSQHWQVREYEVPAPAYLDIQVSSLC